MEPAHWNNSDLGRPCQRPVCTLGTLTLAVRSVRVFLDPVSRSCFVLRVVNVAPGINRGLVTTRACMKSDELLRPRVVVGAWCIWSCVVSIGRACLTDDSSVFHLERP